MPCVQADELHRESVTALAWTWDPVRQDYKAVSASSDGKVNKKITHYKKENSYNKAIRQFAPPLTARLSKKTQYYKTKNHTSKLQKKKLILQNKKAYLKTTMPFALPLTAKKKQTSYYNICPHTALHVSSDN